MTWSAAEDRPRTVPATDPGADAELARAARAGDRDAFSHLYERYASTVHGVLLAAVSREEASDLVQDVFVSALGAIGGLAEPERVGAWLCTIARNRARDHGRRRAAGIRTVLDGEALSALPAESPDADGAEEAEEVLAVIRELPDAYRETLVLRLVEGLPGPEIAARTGMTHGSVRVNLHRGMKLLREELARRGLCEDET